MDLHYSQTAPERVLLIGRFTTLWIYTILKLVRGCTYDVLGFTTLWIYTILKL